MRSSGFTVTLIDGAMIDQASVSQTISAMEAGSQIIAQGALQSGGWIGRTDILRRVDTPSKFGAWSYEVIDTKLARETKGGTVLQLCLYSDLLASVQGAMPEFAYVVAPWSEYQPQAFRIDDYAAYYRRVKSSLEQAVGTDADVESYPEPNEHCEVCRWRIKCDAKWRKDDHLCLVANIGKSQINELKRQSILTTAKLGAMPLPLSWKPDRGAVQSYQRIREQARIQVEGRTAGHIVYEALSVVQGFGLSYLPAPSPGDIFFDLESDPFAGDGGLEYLFGYAFRSDESDSHYVAEWAVSRPEEKNVFERFVDFVIARLERYPDLHIYHYAPYEPAALKRLMGRYSTRENEIDQMLRSGLFIDLYAVVRHAIRASVESYSIKKLEPLYEFEREIALSEANSALAKMQACLELGDPTGITVADRRVVQGYNQDDCFSTWKLRDWLETLRTTLIEQGAIIDRPAQASRWRMSSPIGSTRSVISCGRSKATIENILLKQTAPVKLHQPTKPIRAYQTASTAVHNHFDTDRLFATNEQFIRMWVCMSCVVWESCVSGKRVGLPDRFPVGTPFRDRRSRRSY